MNGIVQFARTLGFFKGDEAGAARRKEEAMVRVLFVCMGNICRSPMAEGMFRRLIEEAGLQQAVYIDSAGTHSYHVGARADRRGQDAAARRGVDLSPIRARRVEAEDLETFDYVLAMDRENFAALEALSEDPSHRQKLRLYMEFAPHLPEEEVPDPYYGGLGGFDRVMDLVEAAGEGFVAHLRQTHRL